MESCQVRPSRAVLACSLLIVPLLLACSWDAPRDNPLDPNLGGNIEGRVLTRRATGIHGAEAVIPALGRFACTDSSGTFEFRGLDEDSVWVRVAAEGYAADSARLGLKKGRIDTVTRYLNGLPFFSECRISSHVYGRGWPPEPLSFFRLTARVADPDGAPDIDSVWAEIPCIEYAERLTFDPEEEHFVQPIWEIPGQSPETLVGQAVSFKVVDNEGGSGLETGSRVMRIIYDLPEPRFPAGGLDTVDIDTTFAWRVFDYGYEVGYHAEIVRVEGGGPAGVVMTFDAAGSADTTFRVTTDSLPEGDYYWTVEAIDRFGNSSRSAEELFHAR